MFRTVSVSIPQNLQDGSPLNRPMVRSHPFTGDAIHFLAFLFYVTDQISSKSLQFHRFYRLISSSGRSIRPSVRHCSYTSALASSTAQVAYNLIRTTSVNLELRIGDHRKYSIRQHRKTKQVRKRLRNDSAGFIHF
jgi:hypothetical protein